MTGRIGTKGQIVIPKSIRDQANLHPGDEVGSTARSRTPGEASRTSARTRAAGHGLGWRDE
jgi:bifunctional DNA-binding transcriptional regulator/antitoxin component of YhaV-PrlF toxin-antitoxin module